MSAYSAAIENACDQRALSLGRDLHTDEVEEVEDGLFREWLTARRFKELVEYATEEFDLQDGEAFCASLGNALCKSADPTLVKQLFGELARKREAAFWRVWPSAERGHIGAMKESSLHLANAMKALAEWYRCCTVLQDEPGKRSVQSEMLRLQDRRAGHA